MSHFVVHECSEELECDLEFLGFIILRNCLKEDTTEHIHTLQQSNLRCVMVTGDNVLTAVCVARECNILPANRRCFISEPILEGDQWRVQWVDSDHPEYLLNPNTLEVLSFSAPRSYSSLPLIILSCPAV